MAKRQKIIAEVTQECIDLGTQRNNGHCAIAIALAKADPNLSHIRVTRDEIRFTDLRDNLRRTFAADSLVRKFTTNWDLDKKSVAPMALEFDYRTAITVKPKARRAAIDVAKKPKAEKRTGITAGKKISDRPV